MYIEKWFDKQLLYFCIIFGSKWPFFIFVLHRETNKPENPFQNAYSRDPNKSPSAIIFFLEKSSPCAAFYGTYAFKYFWLFQIETNLE